MGFPSVIKIPTNPVMQPITMDSLGAIPTPAAPVPVPYPNMAPSATSSAGSMKTSWDTTNAIRSQKLQTVHGVNAGDARAMTGAGAPNTMLP